MILEALQKVFRNSRLTLLAITVAVMVFLFAVWLPNLGLIKTILFDSSISIGVKVNLPIQLIGSISTNFTLLSALYTIIIAILFGVYVAMLTYFLKRRIKEVGKGGVATGFLGIASGVLGVGCAACGSFLLTSLALVGASGTLAFLPLGGSEFGILGVVLLVLAIYMTAKKIIDPLVCKVEV
ncbi:MAG: hypothetical protein Q8P93_04180 [bacterium]|nr:hypothetical protein [bacterium]